MIVIWILFHKYDITLALVCDNNFTENTVPYFKKRVSHFGTNKLYSIEPNLWLLLNWVGFLITILVIKIKAFFHLCYGFLSSFSSSFFMLFYDPFALLQKIFTGSENSCNPWQLQLEADINKLFLYTRSVWLWLCHLNYLVC